VEIREDWILPLSIGTGLIKVLKLSLLKRSNDLVDVVFNLLKIQFHEASLLEFDYLSPGFFLVELWIYQEDIIIVVLLLLLLLLLLKDKGVVWGWSDWDKGKHVVSYHGVCSLGKAYILSQEGLEDFISDSVCELAIVLLN
jgi:hypothetical protein